MPTTEPSGPPPRWLSATASVGKVIAQVILFVGLMNLLLAVSARHQWPMAATLGAGVLVCAPLIHWPAAGVLASLLVALFLL